MKKTRAHIWRFCMAFLTVSIVVACTELLPSIDAPANYSGSNYDELFEAFWNGMNTNYVYWSNDPTNWDSVYTKYKPLFKRLTSFDEANNEKAEKYFTEMTSKIIDSHFSLTFQLSGNTVTPALDRKIELNKQRPDSIYALPPDFFTAVTTKYFDRNSVVTGTDSISLRDTTEPFTVTVATIQGNILYLYFSDFAFSQAGPNTAPVLDIFFNTLARELKSIRGVIIDVRENGGGEITGLNYLLGKMVTKPVTYAYTHAKNGNGRLDYTAWAPAILTPQSGAVNVTQPIVVLADHISASMAEMTALAVMALPNGRFVGTTTWGATGPLIPNVYLNGGQFTIGSANFGNNGYMFVYTSSAALKSSEGQVLEGKGVRPDRWVPETAAAYRAGVDAQLEAAVREISGRE
jgi:carboxyl-terminal processing protease